ncbi:MAG: MBL fold metallo-hydrolase [Candidatus Latescibacteria bacterium]|nr:MBL fold metallo-hydrolase [Candidatus Latescibacterota bacterium]
MKKLKQVANSTDFICFLGTGGARIVVAKQLRATGGIWFSLDHTNFIVDPGPGSLVRMTSSKHGLDPTKLDAILLSHKHLDHSGDINIMIEAITTGGTIHRGALFCPQDALVGDERVILPYLKNYIQEITVLTEGGKYKINNVVFSTPIQQHHPGQVYGFIFNAGKLKISYVVDTKYFPELERIYKADIMIFSVIRLLHSDLEHLSLEDVKTIILKAKPKTAILTHFGMTMLKARPWQLAQELTNATGIKVIAAQDGMKYNISEHA